MKQQILKLVNKIKEDLKAIDKDGVSHPLIDNVYETLELIEDEIYEDDAAADVLSFEDDDY
jgi:ssRNA-specific RNase YbeY (16S rRNA maturation enzyme)